MSVDMVRSMLGAGYIDIDELKRLLNRSESAAYAYGQSTELKWGQAINLLHNARRDDVRELMIAEMRLTEIGYLVIRVPETFDFNGDGGVDDRDVLHKTNESIAHGSLAIAKLAADTRPEDLDAWADELQRNLNKVIAAATAASSAVEWIRAHTPRRLKARPHLVGVGRRGVARG